MLTLVFTDRTRHSLDNNIKIKFMEAITLKELMDIVENVEMYNSEYQLIEDKFKELLSTKLK